jgi:uncharacterized PurR-regulated membrane protein YhhQ (DUF165 family)
LAYLVGEWANSVTLAKMRILTQGCHLWARAIGSAIIGEAVDSMIFYPLAVLFVWSVDLVWRVMLANYVLKVATEVVLTPGTYSLVAFPKRAQNEGCYDIGTDFAMFPRMT